MRVSQNLTRLQPSQSYVVQVRIVDSDRTSDWSNAYTFTTPSATLITKNQNVQTRLTDVGAIISGLIGGPGTNSGMFIDKDGLKAYNNSGSPTVFISSSAGDAYFAGSVVSSAGLIGGFTIGPTSLTAGSGASAVGFSTNSLAFWAGGYDSTDANFMITQDGTATFARVGVKKIVVGGTGNQSMLFYPANRTSTINVGRIDVNTDTSTAQGIRLLGPKLASHGETYIAPYIELSTQDATNPATGDVKIYSPNTLTVTNIDSGRATCIATGFTTVTFAAGRFNYAPYVTATSRNNSRAHTALTLVIGNESTTSFTIYSTDATTYGTDSFNWIAVYM